MHGTLIGTVKGIIRYPVKSMGGEVMLAAGITFKGIPYDRSLLVVRKSDGKIISARSPEGEPLLYCRAYMTPTSSWPWIEFSDGILSADPDYIQRRLSRGLGFEVELADVARMGRETTAGKFLPADKGVDDSPLHIITTNGLQLSPDLDARRFRPNLIIETVYSQLGNVEDTWFDQRLRIGNETRWVEIYVRDLTKRCSVVGAAQNGLLADPYLEDQLSRRNDGHFGVYASVMSEGTIAVSDSVFLLED